MILHDTYADIPPPPLKPLESRAEQAVVIATSVIIFQL